MTDLEKLIDAVEAGICPTVAALNTSPVVKWGSLVIASFDGSLDAAKALHEALLPGWVVRLTHRDASAPHVHVFKMRLVEEDPPQGANSAGFKGHDPARAWLLAVLRAYATRDAA